MDRAELTQPRAPRPGCPPAPPAWGSSRPSPQEPAALRTALYRPSCLNPGAVCSLARPAASLSPKFQVLGPNPLPSADLGPQGETGWQAPQRAGLRGLWGHQPRWTQGFWRAGVGPSSKTLGCAQVPSGYTRHLLMRAPCAQRLRRRPELPARCTSPHRRPHRDRPLLGLVVVGVVCAPVCLRKPSALSGRPGTPRGPQEDAGPAPATTVLRLTSSATRRQH